MKLPLQFLLLDFLLLFINLDLPPALRGHVGGHVRGHGGHVRGHGGHVRGHGGHVRGHVLVTITIRLRNVYVDYIMEDIKIQVQILLFTRDY